MVAFQYRMGAGFPGDVNRTHPASILPCLVDASAPPTLFGQAVLVDPTTQGVRPVVTADGTGITDIFGVTVRPYPFQQQAATNYGAVGFGAGTPPEPGAIDVLRAGYIMIQLNNYAADPSVKAGAVFIWVAASSGQHVMGGFEAEASGGNTAALSPRYFFNSSPDANGITELGVSL